MPKIGLEEVSLIDVDTGIGLEAFCNVVDKYEALLGRCLPGRMSRVIKSEGSC